MSTSADATFRAAVAAIHSPDPSATQTWRAANSWLLSFSEDPTAPSVCVAILQSASATSVEQTFAAGILSRAEKKAASMGPEALLRLCASPASLQAVSSLASPIAGAAVAAKAEDQLVTSPAFAALDVSRQIVLLQELANAICQAVSAEELRYRSSAVAACQHAIHLLQEAVLPSSQAAERAVEPDVSLRCLAAWVGCGVDLTTLNASFPRLAQVLLAALEPRTIVVHDGTSLDPERLHQASLAAGVLRACLQSTLETDKEVTLVSCAPLLRTLAQWVPTSPAPDAPPSATPSPLTISTLGVPALDALGMSDGGGEQGDVCTTLACGLAAVASLALEVLAESLDDAIASASLPSCDEPTRAAAKQARSAMELLLACTLHPRAAVAEVAAEGWLCFARSQPMPVPVESWIQGLFSLVAQRTVSRCSRAQLRLGTGDDTDDLEEWRERSARPLLNACSELLGMGAWLAPIAASMQTANAEARVQSAIRAAGGVPSGEGGAEALEALLFGAACTSPRCVRACPSQVSEGLLADFVGGVRALAASRTTADDAQMALVVQQASACCAALALASSEGDAEWEEDDSDDDE